MTFITAIATFGLAHMFGLVIATMVAHYNDGSWATGPAMIAFSLPTTSAYFAGLWLLGSWRLFPLTGTGFAIAGFISAIYPTFCGLLPVYFLRMGLAIPIIFAQFGFLVLVCVVFSWIDRIAR